MKKEISCLKHLNSSIDDLATIINQSNGIDPDLFNNCIEDLENMVADNDQLTTFAPKFNQFINTLNLDEQDKVLVKLIDFISKYINDHQ